jgi:hypothetical protein
MLASLISRLISRSLYLALAEYMVNAVLAPPAPPAPVASRHPTHPPAGHPRS